MVLKVNVHNREATVVTWRYANKIEFNKVTPVRQ